jgi:hypothetical protein
LIGHFPTLTKTLSSKKANAMIDWTLRNPVRAFLSVAVGTFVVLSLIIFLMPRYYVVQSSIEIGSLVVNGKQDPIDSPEQIARQIAGPYLSSAKLAMAGDDVSNSVLRADAIGRSIVIQTRVPAKLEKDARELQRLILDKVVEDRALFTEVLHDRRSLELESARRRLQALEEQHNSIEIQVTNAILLESEIKKQLAEKRHEPWAAQLNNIVERKIGESAPNPESLLVSLSTVRLEQARLLAQINRQIEDQVRILSSVRDDQLFDTHISAAPYLVPTPVGPTRLYFLIAALAASGLLAFGIVILPYKMRKV